MKEYKLTRRDFLKTLVAVPVVLMSDRQKLSLKHSSVIQQKTTNEIFNRQSLPKRINGINFPSYKGGEYQLPEALESLQNVEKFSINLIGIVPTLYQKNYQSTEIGLTDQSATDTDLRTIIAKAHKMGYTVMLKPHINFPESSDPKHWHGDIGEDFNEYEWRTWFNSYGLIMDNYAKLAEETGVELLVIGNELFHASKQSDKWITIIDRIKAIYGGSITYAAHYNEFERAQIEHLPWWEHLDLLGVNPYYELTKSDYPTAEELRAKWRQISAKIVAIARKYGKSVIFPEIGYPSVAGSAREPWNYKRTYDPASPVDVWQQRDCVGALYESMWLDEDLKFNESWLGVVWWNLDVDPKKGGTNDKGYTFNNKPAEIVVKAFGQSIPK